MARRKIEGHFVYDCDGPGCEQTRAFPNVKRWPSTRAQGLKRTAALRTAGWYVSSNKILCPHCIDKAVRRAA